MLPHSNNIPDTPMFLVKEIGGVIKTILGAIKLNFSACFTITYLVDFQKVHSK